MTLLTIVQDALGRMNLPQPSVVVSSVDPQVKLCLKLADEGGKELSRRGAWKALTAEKTFTTVATEAQTDALPSDLDWIIPDTMFDRTLRRKVSGPISAVDWQYIQASLSNAIFPAFRIRGTSMLISPTPVAGNTVAYEYVTKYWCLSEASAQQTRWTADSDTPVLDEELHILGLIYRFRKSRGLDYAAAQTDYEKQVLQAIQREGSRPRLLTDAMPRIGSDRGADVLAGARPNVVLTEGGDFMLTE
jgi:hypothetical protein